MEFMVKQTQLRHLRIAYSNTGFVLVRVQMRLDGQASLRRCTAYQIHDCLETSQRLAAPVLGYKAEQAMFNLVPFARAGRKMANR